MNSQKNRLIDWLKNLLYAHVKINQSQNFNVVLGEK